MVPTRIGGPPRARPPRPKLALPRLVVLAVEIDRALLQQSADDLDSFPEAGELVIGGKPEGPVLVVVVARPDPQDQASTADVVHRLRHLGEQGGAAKSHAEDQGAELGGARAGRERGEQRPALPGPARLRLSVEQVEEVVHHPDRIESHLLRELRHRPHFAPRVSPAPAHAGDLRHHQSDLEPTRHPLPPACRPRRRWTSTIFNDARKWPPSRRLVSSLRSPGRSSERAEVNAFSKAPLFP